jgi:predicted RNA binding protein YcfA (HicA-like mRNA interferase family)
MDRRRLLRRLREGQHQNVRFRDFRRLVEAFGFQLHRVGGSHFRYAHPNLGEILNLQPLGRQAKPYQIRQLLDLVDRYNLTLEDES